MYSHFLKKFQNIEEQRRTELTSKIDALIKHRNNERLLLTQNIKDYNCRITAENNAQIEQAKLIHEREIVACQLKKEPAKGAEEMQNIETKIQVDNALLKNDTRSLSLLNNEILDIVDQKGPSLTNIPFSEEFISRFIISYQKMANNVVNQSLFEAKRFINKRISQVSTDPSHIKDISTGFEKFVNNPELVNLITNKIVAQGKLQVAIHNDSYKGYAYFFSLIYNENIMQDLRFKVFTDEVVDNNVTKGIYMIYFGILKIKKLFDEAWFFFASMMNVKPIEKSLYVLEAFIIVLGSDVKHFYGVEFEKIQKFICESYCLEINNMAVRTRIKTLLSKLMGPG